MRNSWDYEQESGTLKDGREAKYLILLENSCSMDVIPGSSGNIGMYFLNILVPCVWGNGLNPFSFGKFVIHGCDTRECGAFVRIVSSILRPAQVWNGHLGLG
jgi:hypothetical protein